MNLFITALTLALTSFSQTREITEIVHFKLKDGSSVKEFLKRSSLLTPNFLSKQKGFIKRNLLEGKNGAWVDIVYWESETMAKRATELAYKSSTCLSYFEFIDESTIVMKYYKIKE